MLSPIQDKTIMKTHRNIRPILIALSMVFTLAGQLSAENNYPIVLVHGFVGWGPEEMGGYHYLGRERRFESTS